MRVQYWQMVPKVCNCVFFVSNWSYSRKKTIKAQLHSLGTTHIETWLGWSWIKMFHHCPSSNRREWQEQRLLPWKKESKTSNIEDKNKWNRWKIKTDSSVDWIGSVLEIKFIEYKFICTNRTYSSLLYQTLWESKIQQE